LFALPIEKSFGLQTTFQLLKRQLKGTPAFGFKMVENDLILSTRLIHRESPSHDDMKPLLQAESQTNGRRTEDHRPDLARLVLECTVEMPRHWCTQVRNLPFKPYLGKVGFE